MSTERQCCLSPATDKPAKPMSRARRICNILLPGKVELLFGERRDVCGRHQCFCEQKEQPCEACMNASRHLASVRCVASWIEHPIAWRKQKRLGPAHIVAKSADLLEGRKHRRSRLL